MKNFTENQAADMLSDKSKIHLNLNLNEITEFCSYILLGCKTDYYSTISGNQSYLDHSWDKLYKQLIDKKTGN